MGKSWTAQLGQGIVEVINDSHLAIAVRQYTAEVNLRGLDRNPRVFIRSSVVELPTTNAVTHSRGARFFDVPFELLLINTVESDSDLEAIDSVVGLYEDIDNYLFEFGRLIPLEKSGIMAQWVSSTMDTNVNQDDLRRSKAVQVSGQVTYRYAR
jgi:hypothetical protein